MAVLIGRPTPGAVPLLLDAFLVAVLDVLCHRLADVGYLGCHTTEETRRLLHDGFGLGDYLSDVLTDVFDFRHGYPFQRMMRCSARLRLHASNHDTTMANTTMRALSHRSRNIDLLLDRVHIRTFVFVHAVCQPLCRLLVVEDCPY